MADVAKQLNNPVADLWALNFQFGRYYLQGSSTDRTREQDLMNFQPVLPIHLTQEPNSSPVRSFPSSSAPLDLSRARDGTRRPASAT